MRKPEQQSDPSSAGTTRRQFLACSLSLAALATVPSHAAQAPVAAGRKFRAAIIGHTGHGNYGHEHDSDFAGGPRDHAQNAHPATENIGPVAGDEILAEFAFAKGIHATFVSRAQNTEPAGPWGLELVGSKTSIEILTEMVPRCGS